MLFRATAVVALAGSVAFGQHVVPTAFQNSPAGSTFLGPLSNSQRTYQWLIHESELSSLVGMDLTGITYRIGPAASSSWPAADVNFSNYDIFVSSGVAPADRSLTFASNIVGTQTQVRSGPLSIPAGSFTAGGSPVNAFGPTIAFQTPYSYTGGHLLIELRHMGFTGTSQSTESVAASNTAAGYGTLFSAAWTGSYTGVSGSQGNFTVLKLTAVPAPSGAALLGLGMFAAFRRRR